MRIDRDDYESICSLVKENDITYNILEKNMEIIFVILEESKDIASKEGINTFLDTTIQDTNPTTASGYAAAVITTAVDPITNINRERNSNNSLIKELEKYKEIYEYFIPNDGGYDGNEKVTAYELYSRYINRGQRPCINITKSYDNPIICKNKKCKGIHFDLQPNMHNPKYDICSHIFSDYDQKTKKCSVNCGLPLIRPCTHGKKCKNKSTFCTMLHP
jgi:hypothetical protein